MRGSVLALAIGLVLLSPADAFADEERTTESAPPPSTSESRPGLLNDTAGVPNAMSGWAGLSGSRYAGHTGFDLSAMVSPLHRVAIGASTTERGTTSAGAHVQFLEQSTSGLDLTTSVRWRYLAGVETGHQLFARMVIGRSIGPAYAAVNGGIAQGMGARQDVDYETGALVFVRAARILRAGAEARVRGELVETYVTVEDEGRPVDVLAGGTFGVDLERVLVQALAGWSAPRGPLPAGPAVVGAATLSF
jgi:hypothetical protein